MIERVGSHRIYEAYVKRNASAGATGSVKSDGGTPEAAAPASADSVELSDELRRMQQAIEAARSAPDIRSARVEELRNRVQSGQYHVSSAAIAAKMLGVDDHE